MKPKNWLFISLLARVTFSSGDCSRVLQAFKNVTYLLMILIDISSNDINTVTNALNNDLKMYLHKLSLNTKKTEYMIIAL
jgi:hypothetical protein